MVVFVCVFFCFVFFLVGGGGNCLFVFVGGWVGGGVFWVFGGFFLLLWHYIPIFGFFGEGLLPDKDYTQHAEIKHIGLGMMARDLRPW